MKVTILGDLGPCFGVERAIDEAIDIHQSFPYSKIYFPHPMVHNQRTNDLVKEKTGSEILASFASTDINNLPDESIIMFSAHGHPFEQESLLKEKGIKYFDSFCPLLKTKYASINKAKQNSEAILYYVGKDGHQETVATMANHPYLNFISIKDEIDSLEFNQVTDKQVYVFRQSTLILYPFDKLIQRINTFHPNNVILEKPCPFLSRRYDCISRIDQSENLAFIIVGDKTSSNANELLKRCKETHPNSTSLLVESKEDIDISLFKDIKRAILISSTSALKEDALGIKELLESL